MMYKLRDYQQRASDAAVAYFGLKTKKNGIIVLPTGSGKSLVIADIASRLDAPIVVFQPSKEILEQNVKKMLQYTVMGVGIFSASFGRKDVQRITFATIGSVANHHESFAMFKYAIIDECHMVNAENGMYRDFIKAIRCRVVGLTATPFRLYSSRFNGSMLRFITRTSPKIFTDVLYCVQVKDLLRRGFLANLKYYHIRAIDRARLQLNSTGADYTDQSVRREYQLSLFDQQLANIVQRLLVAGRKSVLVFTRFTDEADTLVMQLGKDVARGVSAQTPSKEREALIAAFKAGRIKVIANVGVLTTGFDYPELDTVVLARPTMSLALYYQMVGRAIRPYVGKDGWVVDMCGNYDRFGDVSDLEIRKNVEGKWAVMSRGRQLTNVYFGK